MALNIDLDGFGFLDSDSEMPSKLSPTLKQPPISPIESESSSGISSLDSDDLKKQLLSSPPTISISHDQDDDDDDEDQQSNDGGAICTEKDEEKEGEMEMDSEEERQSDSAQDEQSEVDEVTVEEIIEVVKVTLPVQVNYQNRNVLNLAGNVWNPEEFIQYTVLPENNLSCFFQNRAQYWRLGNSSGSEKLDALEKCSCCDFSYPSIYQQQQPNNQHGLSMAKNNAITDSLLTFLKNHHADYNNAMPNNNINTNININNNNNNLNNNNNNNNINKRMYNNNNNNNSNNAPYAAYQLIQQQYQQQKNNGYYNNSINGFNQQMNPFNNNGNNANGGYNSGTSALALLNLMNMNQTRSVTAGAFHQAMNNNSRYYNNNMNTNNGYGLYKQF